MEKKLWPHVSYPASPQDLSIGPNLFVLLEVFAASAQNC